MMKFFTGRKRLGDYWIRFSKGDVTSGDGRSYVIKGEAEVHYQPTGGPRRVIVESPYGAPDDATVAENEAYLNRCLRDCAMRGESAYASHGLLTRPGVLNDRDPEERALGIKLGFAWGVVADAVVVYTDRGVSPGMIQGIANATALGLPIEYRMLD